MIFLDTHAVIWLYAGELNRFSKKGLKMLETGQLLISPMVQLEIQFLKEIKRITVESSTILEYLSSSIDLNLYEPNMTQVISEAITLSWTRDPFDRIITASALVENAPLLTKDKIIKKNCSIAVW